MPDIITTTQVQQRIGTISKAIGTKNYIVTNRGRGNIVMLPYFDGCDEAIIDYMENFAMHQQSAKLKRRYRSSLKSGASSLVV